MRSVWGKRILGSVGVLLGVVGIIGVVATVYLRLSTGRGADAFQNGYGQWETWASYAGFLVAAPLILLAMSLAGWWQLWRRSRLEGVSMREIRKRLSRNP
jgi:hypothetical protein